MGAVKVGGVSATGVGAGAGTGGGSLAIGSGAGVGFTGDSLPEPVSSCWSTGFISDLSFAG